MTGFMASPDVSGPKHIAIIMDGNGRWAKQRGLPRQLGHERGVEALRRTVESCRNLDLEHLTVFSFSSENWKRPAEEVSSLFALLRLYVSQDLNKLAKDGVRVRVLGSRKGLPDDILSLIEMAEAKTNHNTRFQLNIAFNYGSRDEIVEAAKALASDVEAGRMNAEEIDSNVFASRLWFAGIPDPDLLIRTSGEFRLSNFLLWQIAYSEMMFLDCLWPDFSDTELINSINAYKSRERRFGGLTVDGLQSE